MRKPRKSSASMPASRKTRRKKQEPKLKAGRRTAVGTVEATAAEFFPAGQMPPVIDLRTVIQEGWRKLQAIQEQYPDWYRQVYAERH